MTDPWNASETVENDALPPLVPWLREQIAADEAVARAATAGPWAHNPRKEWFTDLDKLRAARAGVRQSGGEEFISADSGTVGVAATGPADDPQSMADADHIARFDPVRVLATCAAHRAIVEFHESWPVLVETPPTFDPVDPSDTTSMTFRMSKQIAWATEKQYRERFGTEPPTAPMLRALASIYADREGYRDEWSA